MREVAYDPQPLELLALHREPVLGIGAALGAEGDHRAGVGEVGLRLALGAIVLLLDLPLDRKTVAVPARNVIRVLAHHRLRADDHVLEDLVQPGADMDRAVGVRRAIVEDKFRAAPRLLAQPLVEAEPLPALEQLGLALRQPRLHREVGLGQEQSLAPVAADLRLQRSAPQGRAAWARAPRSSRRAIAVQRAAPRSVRRAIAASAWVTALWQVWLALARLGLRFGNLARLRLGGRLSLGLGGGARLGGLLRLRP